MVRRPGNGGTEMTESDARKVGFTQRIEWDSRDGLEARRL